MLALAEGAPRRPSKYSFAPPWQPSRSSSLLFLRTLMSDQGSAGASQASHTSVGDKVKQGLHHIGEKVSLESFNILSLH